MDIFQFSKGSLLLVATLLIVVACAKETDEAAGRNSASGTNVEKAKSAMGGNRESALAPEVVQALTVYIMNCGTIKISDLDGFSTAGDYAGKSDTFTDTCYLVRHPEGDLLWDLGLPAATLGDGVVNGVFTVNIDETLADTMAKLNLAPSDIDYVAISHGHFDHTGQPEAAGDATWLVHQREYDAMFADDETAQQYAAFTGLDRQTFTRDYDVFGDGSVTILELPGHTPGHTALQLMMPEAGPVLLTGDLYHRAESRQLRRVPRFNTDEEETRRSMERFEKISDTLGARVIIQHEPADVATLPEFPEPLR